MEPTSFRFFSRSFLGILLMLFLCTFGVVWGLREYYVFLLNRPHTPAAAVIKKQVLKTEAPSLSESAPDFVMPASGKEVLAAINQGDCVLFYEKLRATADTPSLQVLVKRLMPFCGEKHQPVLKELEKTFLKAEQKALVLYYKQTETGWRQRGKILLTYLMHIRKENPTGNSVPATLNRIHNAVRQGDLVPALQLIETLPSALQPPFVAFNLQAENYLSIAHLLEEYTAL